MWQRLQQHYTWQKKQHKTPLDDSTRILHQTTGLMSKVNRAHCWINVSYLRGVVEGPGRSISVKKIAKQWVKHLVSKRNIWKAWTSNMSTLYLILSPNEFEEYHKSDKSQSMDSQPVGHKGSYDVR